MDEVEEVKSKVDIVALIGEYVDLKKAGRNYKGRCPFHSEKTPSFMVSGELQLYKCFGCGASGDVFSFLMAHEGMEFSEALKFLAGRVGVELKKRPVADGGLKAVLYEANLLAARFYNYILTTHTLGKVGTKYLLEDRKLTPKAITTFNLGFAPDDPRALTDFLTKKKGMNVSDLITAGLVIKSDSGRVFDRFRGRVIFPLYDHRGNVVALAGRIMPGTKADIAKYINSPETPIYHKGSILYGFNVTKGDIKREGMAVVVEGELDAISSWQAGVKNTVAIKGSALTEDHAKVLSRVASKVVLALDSDFAGNEAARRGIFIAQATGVEVSVATLDPYKDPDDAARADPKLLLERIKGSVGVWDFIIDAVVKREDPTSGEGKSRISREVVPLLAKIADKIVQAHYAAVLAGKLGIPTDAVFSQIQQVASKSDSSVTINQPGDEEVVVARTASEVVEEELLHLLVTSAASQTTAELIDMFTHPVYKKIASELFSFLKHNPYEANKFAATLPKELLNAFVALILIEKDEPAQRTDDEIAHELVGLVKRRKELAIKEERIRLTSELARFESQANKEEVRRIEDKIHDLDTQLSLLSQDHP